MGRSVVAGAGGLLYGGVLSLIGLLLGVEGNTSNWVVVSSPFAGIALLAVRLKVLLLPDNVVGWTVILVSALFWAALFSTASTSGSHRGKSAVIACLVIHYIASVATLIYMHEQSDTPSPIFVSVYVLGQIYLWWELMRKRDVQVLENETGD